MPKSNLKETGILLSQLYLPYQNKIYISLFKYCFGHVSITRLKRIARKLLMEGLLTNISDLEETFPICIFTNETKTTRYPTIDVSKFAHGFMLQMYFVFFNFESIRGFNSNFVAICSATS